MQLRALSYPSAEEKSLLEGQSLAGYQRYLGAVGCPTLLPEVSGS